MKRLLMLIIVAGFLMANSIVWADEKQDKIEIVKANAILPLKIERLRWKTKYYQQKVITLQLQALLRTWNDIEFQEAQRIIRETNQEIKQLMVSE